MKNCCFNKKRAFTLAEVLITLGIIGIVAAMTIPTLMNKVQNQQNVVALKKAYAIFSQASMMVANDNGGTLDADGIYNTVSSQAVFDAFAPHLKIIKACGSANVGGCLYNTRRLNIKGVAINTNLNSDFSVPIMATGILSDGMMFAFYSPLVGSCNLNRNVGSIVGTSDKNDACGTIEVDVNGEKLPNQVGRDIFAFIVLSNGTIYPAGAFSTDAQLNGDCSTNSTDHGFDCAAKVLSEGAENY